MLNVLIKMCRDVLHNYVIPIQHCFTTPSMAWRRSTPAPVIPLDACQSCLQAVSELVVLLSLVVRRTCYWTRWFRSKNILSSANNTQGRGHGLALHFQHFWKCSACPCPLSCVLFICTTRYVLTFSGQDVGLIPPNNSAQIFLLSPSFAAL